MIDNKALQQRITNFIDQTVDDANLRNKSIWNNKQGYVRAMITDFLHYMVFQYELIDAKCEVSVKKRQVKVTVEYRDSYLHKHIFIRHRKFKSADRALFTLLDILYKSAVVSIENELHIKI